MEIADYLKMGRRRLWIIVLVPLLAAAGVLGYHYATPTSYQARAYVYMPNVLSGQYTGPAGTSEWVNAFTATAASPLVTRRVAGQTGVPAKQIENGIQVNQVQQSWQLEVDYTGTNPTVANQVVKGVASQTPRALFAPQVAQAKKAVARAQANLLALNQQVLAAAAQAGSTTPGQFYMTQLRTLDQLKQQQATALANGDTATADAVSAKISVAKAQLQSLQAQVAGYRNLLTKKQAAAGVLATAQQNLQAVSTQLAGITAKHAVTVLPVTAVGLKSVLLKGVLPALIAALLLAFCGVAAMELLSTRQRMATPDSASSGRSLRKATALRPFPVSSSYRGEITVQHTPARSPLGAPNPSPRPIGNGHGAAQTRTSEKGNTTSGSLGTRQAAAASRR